MDDSDHQSDPSLLAQLGARVAARRIECRLTQAMLASAASISKRTVERLETGNSVQFIYLLRVVRVLGLLDSVSRLIATPVTSDPTVPIAKRVRMKSAGRPEQSAAQLSPPQA